MKNRFNISLVLFFAFSLLSSSTTGSYNKPFINTDETLKITEGMTKELILLDIGLPYFVESGKNDTEIWVYNVRTIMVLSDKTKNQPNKKHPQTKHDNIHHELQIIFKNDKVISWGPYNTSENESNISSEDNEDHKSSEKVSFTKNLNPVGLVVMILLGVTLFNAEV